MARRSTLIRRVPGAYPLAACCLALLAFAACATPPEPGPRKRTVLMDAGPEAAGESRRAPALVTRTDDARVGREEARSVAETIGILDAPALNAYVDRIGQRLVKGLPHRSFGYEFRVVDQVEPNAFALPGGYVFISRGLLALARNEDELANVLGHEITHAAQRHAAARQAMIEQKGMLLILPTQAASMAAYSRDMERSADEGGQILAAAAGYDPKGMASFMASLYAQERLLLGTPRRATYFDTHPTSAERASMNAIRAGELRWVRDPALGDTVTRYLRSIEGIDIGPRPQEGVFVAQRFLHPDLDFQIRFPDGWRTLNERSAVGAQAPRGRAVVFLSAEKQKLDPKAAAEVFVTENRPRGLRVTESKPVRLSQGDAWRLELEVPQQGGSIIGLVTFLTHKSATWRFTGATLAFDRSRYEDVFLLTFRSFRPLTPEQRASIRGTRLELVEARPGETPADICKRADNVWSPSETALANGVSPADAFRGGELVKIARSYAYAP